jgi:hypothetical protein
MSELRLWSVAALALKEISAGVLALGAAWGGQFKRIATLY